MQYLVFCFAFISYVVSTPPPIDDGRIVGGKGILISEAPYQAALLKYEKFICGGAIIANDTILTAAHCVHCSKAENFQVRVGSSFSDVGGEVFQVRNLTWHPGFKFKGMDYDIAVLLLSKQMTYTRKIAPIVMKSECDLIPDGAMTIVTGWGNVREEGGQSKMLQRVAVPKVNDLICNKLYSPTHKVTPRMICAGLHEGGEDACQGDSGGPFVHNKKLAGVVSWGRGCARPDHPGVYTRISALRKWIDTSIVKLKGGNV